MSRKPSKQFERWILIGVVVLLIATFSVTGVTGRGCDRGAVGSQKYGGTFEVAPGKVRTVTDEDFQNVHRRYSGLYTQVIGPSLRFRGEMSREDRLARREIGTWIHLVHVEVAKEAGYRVSDEEVRATVREVVPQFGRRSGFTVEGYNEFLMQLSRVSHRGGGDPITKVEFETTIREYLLKDKFLGDLVTTDRYAIDREEAFGAWKASRERVDLLFAALSGTHFLERLRLDEQTRTSMASLLAGLGRLHDASREVRRANAILTTWREKQGGVWPADEADLLGKEPGGALAQKDRDPTQVPRLMKDPWGFPLVYVPAEAAARIVSAGPDGEPGTGDDVTPEITTVLDGLAMLRRTGDALQNWHRDAGSWPSTLDDLLKPLPPKEGKPALPALLAEVPKDPWGTALVFQAEPVRLVSAGPDKVLGSEDDLVAEASSTPATLVVRAPIQVAPWIPEGTRTDAWGRTIAVGYGMGRFEASSSGANDVVGDEDDVRDGNQADLEAYYASVKRSFALPIKREFEALYVVPSLVSDEIFAKAWAAMPQFRPEEREAWDTFRALLGSGYVVSEGEGASEKSIDPADPEKGYGAELRRDLAERGVIPAGTKGYPVPAVETLGDRAARPAATTPGLPDPDADPLYKTYVERGWRQILLRDQFFAKLLDGALKTGREAEEKLRAWHDSGKQGVEPKVDAARFDAQLAAWQDLQPGADEMAAGVRSLSYYRTPEPLDRPALEALPVLGDSQLFSYIDSAKDGDYDVTPRALHGGPALMALRTVKRHPERDAELAEIRDKPEFMNGYLDARAIDRAARELERVRATLLPPPAASRRDGEDPPPPITGPAQVEAFEKAFAAAAAERGLPIVLDRTGLYVGSTGSVMRTPVAPDDATEAERDAMARRAFVRAMAYKSVRDQDSTRPSSVGALGRFVVPDRDPEEGRTPTRSAYLVIVAEQADPVKEAFHGRAFLDWVRQASYGMSQEWAPPRANLADRKGRTLRLLHSLYDDWDRAKDDYRIRTNEDLLLPKNAGPAR